MLRSILIGLDSSASGIAAQELGIEWSQLLGCQLIGITIVDGPVFPYGEDVVHEGATGRGEGSTLVAEPNVQVGTSLLATEDAFGRRCREGGVAYQVLEEIGAPHVQILLEAQKHDIVLLGQHSRFDYGWEGKPGETLGNGTPGQPPAGSRRARAALCGHLDRHRLRRQSGGCARPGVIRGDGAERRAERFTSSPPLMSPTVHTRRGTSSGQSRS